MEGSFPSKCNFSTFTSIFLRDNEFCRMVLVSTMTVVTLVTYWKKMRSLKVEETFNVHLEIGQIMSRFYNVELWLELNWSPIQTECKDIVNGSDIPNYERQSTPVFTVDIIAIFSTVFILMYFVLLLLNKDKPVVSKMGKIYHGGHLKSQWNCRIALLSLPVWRGPAVWGLWRAVPQLPTELPDLRVPPVPQLLRADAHVLRDPREDEEGLHDLYKVSHGQPRLTTGLWSSGDLPQVSQHGGQVWTALQRTL